MERAAWTDERLDDLAEGMRTGFGRIDQDMRDLRNEMNTGFTGIREEVSGLRGEIDSLKLTLLRLNGGMVVGLIGVIVAIFARGA